ncbi:hemK methyltransferase 2 isoform X2 [Brevipalpus obovatus]|uniref:hemK methyltransferase 2 isoform X2 n=1 Tax=Brevipalpus obovatus TaxID=246614 RepID=UPI003D9F100F
MKQFGSPKTSHVLDTPLWSSNSNVYEPREDSFLFLDCLGKDLDLIKSLKPTICLEIGTGTCILTTALCKALGPSQALYLATDINQNVIEAGIETFQKNGLLRISPNIVLADLFENFGQSFKTKTDLLLFNPPYVPTEDDEVNGDLLSKSWAGGPDGRAIIDRFIIQAPDFMANNSLLYLLLIKENKPNEVIELLAQKSVFLEKIVIERKCHNEHQMILRFRKSI